MSVGELSKARLDRVDEVMVRHCGLRLGSGLDD
jgi:hypothetical protein